MSGLNERDLKQIHTGHYGIFRTHGKWKHLREEVPIENNHFKYDIDLSDGGTILLHCEENGKTVRRVHIQEYDTNRRLGVLMSNIDELKEKNKELDERNIYLEGLINAISRDLTILSNEFE